MIIQLNKIAIFLNKKVYNLFEIAGNLLVHDNRGIFKIQNLELNEYLPIYLGNELNLKKLIKMNLLYGIIIQKLKEYFIIIMNLTLKC